MKFIQVTLRNFFSYGNDTTTVNLQTVGTTLIAGNNGVGKSTIINAVVYALYDRVINDVTKDNMINNINDKQLMVTLDYIGNDNKKYHIERYRKMKSGADGTGVKLFCDGTDITSSTTNADIIKTIGIPYDLFVSMVVYTASKKPFLDLKSNEQIQIIEELFGLTLVSEKAALLAQEIKSTKQKIEIQQVKIDAINSELERHNTQIANAQTRVNQWETNKNRQITEIQRQLDKISNVDLDQQQAYCKELDEVKSKLKELESSKKLINQQLTTLQNKTTSLTNELTHLRDDTCPYCLQHMENAQDKIKNKTTELEQIQTYITSFKDEASLINDDINQLTKLKQTLLDNIEVSDIDELIAIKNQSTQLTRQLSELSESTNPFVEPLQELTNMQIGAADYDEINKLTTILDHQKFLQKLLTKKDSFVRKMLLNKNLPLLNKKLQEYIKELGLPHRVEFSKDMSATISQFGRTLSFGNLSQGQRARVNFALAYAFIDVEQDLHPKINLRMLDEVFDYGLDPTGVINASNLVKNKAEQDGTCVFVISHRDEVSSTFDNKIVVQVDKGFSHIKQ